MYNNYYTIISLYMLGKNVSCFKIILSAQTILVGVNITCTEGEGLLLLK